LRLNATSPDLDWAISWPKMNSNDGRTTWLVRLPSKQYRA
jgi:hypothetical protein